MLGSSPLTRGKLAIYVDVIDDEGLIPAHAGKTPRANTPRPASWAHPRSRGENATVRLIRTVTAGSSPLTRGKHGARQRTRRLSGLIPAHAGKTFAPTPKSIHGEAHPRSRGENHLPGLVDADDGGSSPLTRGKLDRLVRAVEPEGLIPAHAGKTWLPTERYPSRTAHPRSRGENSGVTMHALRHRGSSPLTRGKLTSSSRSAADAGLIPAHAGKTHWPTRELVYSGAHPRSRGENDGLSIDIDPAVGSSPLTRGKRRGTPLATLRGRLIPAHAGKTRWPWPARP